MTAVHKIRVMIMGSNCFPTFPANCAQCFQVCPQMAVKRRETIVDHKDCMNFVNPEILLIETPDVKALLMLNN